MAVTGTPTTGNDSLVGDGADDTISALDGDDTVKSGGGNDTVYGDGGNDKLYGGSGHDVLYGGDGNDRVEGQNGNDTISGGLGNDVLIGGAGDDVLTGGAGLDRLYGGAGSDTFVLVSETGVIDNVYDFTVGEDLLDVSGLTDAFGNPVDVDDVVVTSTNGGASSILTFPDGTKIRLYGVTASELDTDAELISIGIPCLTRGSMVGTSLGEVAVENLKSGDHILSRCDRTGELVPTQIKRIYNRRLSSRELTANPKLYPVKISQGSLGDGLPKRDLWVSRQHRMLTKSRVANRMFGRFDVLVSAIKLSGLDNIFVDTTVQEVEYFHILLDNHAIILAEGALTESLYTGKETINTLSADARDEIYTLFPELHDPSFEPETICPVPLGRKQKKLIERLTKNGLDFVEA